VKIGLAEPEFSLLKSLILKDKKLTQAGSPRGMHAARAEDTMQR